MCGELRHYARKCLTLCTSARYVIHTCAHTRHYNSSRWKTRRWTLWPPEGPALVAGRYREIRSRWNATEATREVKSPRSSTKLLGSSANVGEEKLRKNMGIGTRKTFQNFHQVVRHYAALQIGPSCWVTPPSRFPTRI